MTLPTPATETDTGPRMPGRERLCAATREVRPIGELIRFVAGPHGLVPDLKRKLPGRGVWVTARRDTVTEAVKRGTFKKSLKTDVSVPSDLSGMVDKLMVRAALDALSIAHKAREVVAGTGKVEDAIAGDRAVAILHARDAAPDGVRKLAAALRRRSPGDGGSETGGKVPVIRAFTSAELDLALGRLNVVHAALLAGRAGETFLMRWHDLRHFRMPEEDPDYREDDAGVPDAAAQKLEME